MATTWLQSTAMSFIPTEQSSTASSPTDSNDGRTWYNTIDMTKVSTSQQPQDPSWQNIMNILCPSEETPIILPAKRKEQASPRLPSYDSYAGEVRPWPSVHQSIDYPMTGEEEFIAVLSQQNTDSDTEDLQCSLNSYYCGITEGDGEMELPYPIKIIPEIIAAGQELEEHWELEYTQLAQLTEHLYSSSAISTYRPPVDTTMGPPNYPPTVEIGEVSGQKPSFEGYRGSGKFKSKDYSEMWNLPSTFQHTGAMFIIPTHLGKFDEVFMRWESITKNLVSLQGFTDATSEAEFM
ncbi:hypothetical protein ZIOFF_016200 [Zingiber officinale]|uniref:Uncharacterized protein n=1 Tax=Zingiber officinale TaxID=94328 RepID=A0A8J5I1E5_ZINOF|nr:hypothetical protein ZIOFF_016200 [Zingiber officinale]